MKRCPFTPDRLREMVWEEGLSVSAVLQRAAEAAGWPQPPSLVTVYRWLRAAGVALPGHRRPRRRPDPPPGRGPSPPAAAQVERPCAGCGQPVIRRASRMRAETVYCSRSCRSRTLSHIWWDNVRRTVAAQAALPEEERLLDVSQAAARLGVSRTTIYSRVRAGLLPPAERVAGRVLLFRPADVDAAGRPTAPGGRNRAKGAKRARNVVVVVIVCHEHTAGGCPPPAEGEDAK
jgi:excisionase family DNA binding protein